MRARSESQGENYDRRPLLAVRAAGNEGARIDSYEDVQYCDKGSNQLIVGNYILTPETWKVWKGSNYGACVALYGFGTNVITRTAGGFQLVTTGTSFAAPLAVRYLTLAFPRMANPADLGRALLSRVDNRKFLPKDSFPAELNANFIRKKEGPVQKGSPLVGAETGRRHEDPETAEIKRYGRDLLRNLFLPLP